MSYNSLLDKLGRGQIRRFLIPQRKLAQIAIKSQDESERNIAILGLWSQSLLEKVAKECPYVGSCEIAVKKLRDPRRKQNAIMQNVIIELDTAEEIINEIKSERAAVRIALYSEVEYIAKLALRQISSQKALSKVFCKSKNYGVVKAILDGNRIDSNKTLLKTPLLYQYDDIRNIILEKVYGVGVGEKIKGKS